jgi:hypothetical protein
MEPGFNAVPSETVVVTRTRVERTEALARIHQTLRLGDVEK